jgi:L,D-transpeptidase ErfK/SrfK
LTAAGPVHAEIFPVAPGQDTLPDIARRYDVGFDEIIAANPGTDAWAPGARKIIRLPTQRLLPANGRPTRISVDRWIAPAKKNAAE